MDTDPVLAIAAKFAERLTQALRVMENLSDADKANFTLDLWAQRRPTGLCACIAGHCGLDPWFRERGLVTTIGDGIEVQGSINVSIEEFFGTNIPFFSRSYQTEVYRAMAENPSLEPEVHRITHAETVASLRKEIARFTAYSCKQSADE